MTPFPLAANYGYLHQEKTLAVSDEFSFRGKVGGPVILELIASTSSPIRAYFHDSRLLKTVFMADPPNPPRKSITSPS